MGKTQKRIEKRKAQKAARAVIVAQNQAEALQRHARQAERGFTAAQFADDPWFDSDHDYETPDFQTGDMTPRWKTEDSDVWPAGFRGELRYSGVGLVGTPARETKNGKAIPAVTPAQQASAIRQEQFKQAVKVRGAAHFRTMSHSETQAMLARYGTNVDHDLGYVRKSKHTEAQQENKPCAHVLAVETVSNEEWAHILNTSRVI